jgi:hypothetical protein
MTGPRGRVGRRSRAAAYDLGGTLAALLTT